MKTFIKNNGLYIFGIIILFLLWEIIALLYNNDIVFPTIGEISQSFIGDVISANGLKVFLNTILRLLISISISVMLAVIMTVLSRFSIKIKKITTPLITILKATPVAAFIIIILVIIGHEKSSTIISILVMFPILYEGFYNSCNAISNDIKDEVKTISKVNISVLKKVYLPIMMPYIITCFLQTISLGVKSLIMAELITQPKYSIGRELLQYKNALNMSGILAWTMVLIIILIVVEIVLNNIKNKIEKQI